MYNDDVQSLYESAESERSTTSSCSYVTVPSCPLEMIIATLGARTTYPYPMYSLESHLSKNI